MQTSSYTCTWNYDIYTYAGNHVCCVIQTLGVWIIWAGPDHHTPYYKTILQLIMEKLLIITYMSLYTPSTHTCFVGCELYGLHEWATIWFPATEQYTWATRGELYELLNSIIYMYVCHVWAIFYSLSTHFFPGWTIWATDKLARDLFDVCKTMTDRGQRVALPSI